LFIFLWSSDDINDWEPLFQKIQCKKKKWYKIDMANNNSNWIGEKIVNSIAALCFDSFCMLWTEEPKINGANWLYCNYKRQFSSACQSILKNPGNNSVNIPEFEDVILFAICMMRSLFGFNLSTPDFFNSYYFQRDNV
jgi:hypothetical protein